MTTTIYRERLPYHPLLGRHVHHDSRSRAYAYDTSGLSIVSAKHTRRIDVLDQDQLGSCVPNAGEGCLGTDPFYATVATQLTWGEPLAVSWYSDVTAADPYPGQWPPDDTGSDGLSMAKVLKAKGLIAGYQHTFSLDDALKALTVTPFITGTVWTEAMFTPDPDGRVYPTGAVAGGHEYVADEIDADRMHVWFTNSWGSGWGVARDGRPGRFYMFFEDYGALLQRQGDVTIFTPLTQPAPTPTPAPDTDPADVALAAVAHPWVARRHTSIAGNNGMKRALQDWLREKGL